MLQRETSHSYEKKIGTTTFIEESESPENGKEDMLDAIVALVKRDIENLSFELDEVLKTEDSRKAKIIPFENKTD